MACINHPDSNDVKTITTSISSATSSQHIDRSISDAKNILKELNQLKRSAKTPDAVRWARQEASSVEKQINNMETIKSRREHDERAQQEQQDRQYRDEQDRQYREQQERQYREQQERQHRDTRDEYQLQREIRLSEKRNGEESVIEIQKQEVRAEKDLTKLQKDTISKVNTILNEINAEYKNELLDRYKDGYFTRDKSNALIGTDVHMYQLPQVVEEVLHWYDDNGRYGHFAKQGVNDPDYINDVIMMAIELKPKDEMEVLKKKYGGQFERYKSQRPSYDFMLALYDRLK